MSLVVDRIKAEVERVVGHQMDFDSKFLSHEFSALDAFELSTWIEDNVLRIENDLSGPLFDNSEVAGWMTISDVVRSVYAAQSWVSEGVARMQKAGM